MSMVTTCTELYYSFIKMCLHFKKHWVFIKRCGKYGRMVVNFYEEKDKKPSVVEKQLSFGVKPSSVGKYI